MNRFSSWAMICWISVAVVGCDSKVPVDSVSVKLPAPQKTEPAPSVSIDRSKLPAELMNDAYLYYGLSNMAPVDITIKTTSQPSTESGSLQSKLTKIEGNEATFAIERTGSLKDELGDETVVLRKDGIYEKSMTKGELDKETLELPSDLSKGKAWEADVTLKTATGAVTQKMRYVSQGIVPVTDIKNVKEALVITGTGTYTVQGASTPVKYKTWYVKGVGLVKNMTAVTPKGKPAVSMLLELTPDQKNTK